MQLKILQYLLFGCIGTAAACGGYLRFIYDKDIVKIPAPIVEIPIDNSADLKLLNLKKEELFKESSPIQKNIDFLTQDLNDIVAEIATLEYSISDKTTIADSLIENISKAQKEFWQSKEILVEEEKTLNSLMAENQVLTKHLTQNNKTSTEANSAHTKNLKDISNQETSLQIAIKHVASTKKTSDQQNVAVNALNTKIAQKEREIASIKATITAKKTAFNSAKEAHTLKINAKKLAAKVLYDNLTKVNSIKKTIINQKQVTEAASKALQLQQAEVAKTKAKYDLENGFFLIFEKAKNDNPDDYVQLAKDFFQIEILDGQEINEAPYETAELREAKDQYLKTVEVQNKLNDVFLQAKSTEQALDNKIKTLQTEIRKLKAELPKHIKDQADAKALQTALETHIQELNNSLSSEEAVASGLKEQLASEKNKAANLRSKAQAAILWQSTTQDKLDKLSLITESLSNAKIKANQNLSETAQLLEKNISDLSKFKENLDSLQKSSYEKREVFETMSQKQLQNKEELDTAQTTFDDLSARLDSSSKQLEEDKQSLLSLQIQIAQVDKQIIDGSPAATPTVD